MRSARLAVAAGVGIVMLASQGGRAGAAEIRLISSNGVSAVLSVLGPQFEKASGDTLVIHFDTANALKDKILAGEDFDVAILTGPIVDELIKAGKIAAGSRTDIARSGVGVAIRAGASRPDISTVEAFKHTLLAAKSVAYTTTGASGLYFAGLIERLGIADQVKAKAKLQPGGAVAELVASGEAELAVQQLSELMPVKGSEILGPLPPELQHYTVFSAGMGTAATQTAAAKALVEFLTAPAALPIIKAKGMEPGA
jgi:molybdate transport system substrate-binding protein